MSADAKKIVLKLDLHDNEDKRKAMKAVSKLQGIDSIAVDMKGGKLTVTGVIDPVRVANKLRKSGPTDILSVGPAKEEKKKEEPKKDGDKKKEEEAKKKQMEDFLKAYPDFNNPYMMRYYYAPPVEENPNISCVIC